MDLINRYIYAVTRRLPVKQQGDIDKELRSLIDDMLEQYEGSEAYEVKVQKVLLDLGDPEIMANNYRGAKRYLIGPENFDNYILILKIVMGAVFIGLSVATIVNSAFAVRLDFISIFSNYFGILFSGWLQAFAWVTIIFAVADYRGVDLKGAKRKDEPWSLSELPLVPEKNTAISPWEAIVSILFATVFMTMLYFAPHLFAAYIPIGTNGVRIIPIFNLPVIYAYRVLIAVVFILSVLKEVLKLVSGRWTLKLSIGFSILSIITTALMVMIFMNPGIWNPDFAAEVMKNAKVGIDFSNIWIKFTGMFILVMIAACILDVSKALYKGVKYNISK